MNFNYYITFYIYINQTRNISNGKQLFASKLSPLKIRYLLICLQIIINSYPHKNTLLKILLKMEISVQQFLCNIFISLHEIKTDKVLKYTLLR